MNVAMICETLVTPNSEGAAITRDDITCNVQYAANGMTYCCDLSLLCPCM